jgi:hypothetical protein
MVPLAAFKIDKVSLLGLFHPKLPNRHDKQWQDFKAIQVQLSCKKTNNFRLKAKKVEDHFKRVVNQNGQGEVK